MNLKPVNSVILIALTLLGTTLILAGYIPTIPPIKPVTPIAPDVYAAPPFNSATVGIFSESKRSNAVIDPTILGGQTFTVDVNVTDAAQIKTFDVNLTFTSASIVYSSSSLVGGIFSSASLGFNQTATCKTGTFCQATGNPNWYRLSALLSGTVNGNGVIFRVTFITVASGVASVIHFDSTTKLILGGTRVSENFVDGYFDSRSSPSNFGISQSPASVTAVRPVSGPSSAGGATVMISSPANVGPITYSPLSLPLYTVYSNGTNPCSAACTSTLTIWVNGGPKGGAGETVIYDSNGDGRYSTGKFYNDTVILLDPRVVLPLNNTVLSSDPKIKFIGAGSSWVPGNTVVYDTNGNGLYDAGEPVIVGSQPRLGQPLKSDPKLKYWDSEVPANGVWDSGTTPSGTYFIPIVGSTTSTNGVSGSVVRVTWLTLIVQPPPSPVFTVAASPASSNQQAGNYSLFTITVSLTSGSNDTIGLTSNCLLKFAAKNSFAHGQGCDLKSQQGKFPLTTTMNVSSNAAYSQAGTQPWVFKFNVTATTLGTYSEVLATKNATITINLLKTHDLAASTVSNTLGRSFGYVGISLPTANQLQENVTVKNLGTVTETFTVNATAKVALTPNTNLRWVDSGGNVSRAYVSGEPVILDVDGNGAYGFGKYDSHILFSGPGTTWVAGNAVVYDADSDGIYMTGRFLPINDTIISGTIANNTALKIDLKLTLVDCASTGTPAVCDNNGAWESGEAVFYDTNGNGVFDTGETVIAGTAPGTEPVIVMTAPALGTALSNTLPSGQPLYLSFVDTNYNGVLCITACSPGDAIVYDAKGLGVFENGDPVARPTTPSAGFLLGTTTITLAAGAQQIVSIKYDPGSLPQGRYILAGAAMPVPGEFDFSNNQVRVVPFTQKLKGDISGHCTVDIADLSAVGASFGSTKGGTAYKAAADLFNVGVVDIAALSLIGSQFHATCAA